MPGVDVRQNAYSASDIPIPTFRQEWLIRACRKWPTEDLRQRYWTLAHAARISPGIDPDLLLRSFRGLLTSVPSLRWSFGGHDDVVTAKILDPEDFSVLSIDVAGVSPEALRLLVNERALELIKPEGGPLLRLTAYHERHQTTLLLQFHHVLVDGWSVMLFIRELVQCFINRSTNIAPAASNFPDFALWQRRFVNSEQGKKQFQFWMNTLNDLPSPLRLPYDRPDGGTFTEGAYATKSVSSEIADAVGSLASTLGITPFRLLLAAFNLTIYSMTGTPDAPVISAVANRTRAEFLETIGWIANNVQFRAPILVGQDLTQYCKVVSESVDQVLENQEYPESLIMDALVESFPGIPTALDQIAFGVDMPHVTDESGISGLLFRSGAGPIKWGDYSFESIDLPSIECNRDLTLIVKYRSKNSGQSSIDLILNYRKDVFDDRTAERILQLYSAVVERVILYSASPITSVVSEMRTNFSDLAIPA